MKARWTVSDEVLLAFHRHTKAERERILRVFDQIAEFPANRADYEERGPDGRIYSVSYLRPWLVTFWIDPDKNLIRFVELEFVK